MTADEFTEDLTMAERFAWVDRLCQFVHAHGREPTRRETVVLVIMARALCGACEETFRLAVMVAESQAAGPS